MNIGDRSGWGDPQPYRSKTDLTANNHLASLEKEVSRLKEENRQQAEELKAVTWMCQACGATYPSMLARAGMDGKLICPRCGEGGKVLRAHEALQAMMKEKTRQAATDAENQTLLKEQLALLKDKMSRTEFEKQKALLDIERLRGENAALSGAVATLKEALRKERIRPGEGRAVEGELDA